MSLTTKKIQRFASRGKVDKIIPGLHHDDQAVRKAATEALEASEDSKAVNALSLYWIDALDDPDWEVRQRAALRLQGLASRGHLRDEDVVSAMEPLFNLLKGKDLDLRVAAAEALGEFRRTEALELLIAAMNDESSLPVRRVPLTVCAEPVDARVAAALAVGKIGGESAEKALKALLNASGPSGVIFGQTIAEAVREALTGQRHGSPVHE